MKVLILKNIEREGPGLIANWLNDSAIQFDVMEVSEGLLDDHLSDKYDGLIVLGGPSLVCS